MDIEKLKKRCGYDGKPQQWQYGFDLACRELAKYSKQPQWISVEDSLPNRQVNVLVASKHNFVCIASLTNNHKNNKFYDGDSLAINSITHWMPLPEPPTKECE